MTLSEKIMSLRKERGWSQEFLADKLGVSRQSVSKWEMGQSVPDLKRIVDISNLFGADCNFLLKEETATESIEQALSDVDFIDHLKTCHIIACRKADIFSVICDKRISLDKIVTIIREAESRREAEGALMEQFEISESVAQGILDLRVPELTANTKDTLLYYRMAEKQLKTLIGEAHRGK